MSWAFLMGGMLLLAASAHAASVLSIGAGTTITVTKGSERIKVRLTYLDAPGISQFPYGMEARTVLRGLLLIGYQVILITNVTGRSCRNVAKVFKGSININQSLVGSGNALCSYIKQVIKQHPT